MASVHYNEVIYWVKYYGDSGAPDKTGVQLFIDSETGEKIKALRAQLYAISKGQYDERSMDLQIGAKRRAKHGSYEEWAKLMLQWLATYKG
ncbi:MAG: hypothetical protein KDD64_17365 [Bdellovibrionales bacterium]|nr:hypothetical protein [Bdellovibrionales bacterium]